MLFWGDMGSDVMQGRTSLSLVVSVSISSRDQTQLTTEVSEVALMTSSFNTRRPTTTFGVLVLEWYEMLESDSSSPAVESLYDPSHVLNKSEIFLMRTLVSSSLEVRSEPFFSEIERKRQVVSCTGRGEDRDRERSKV